MPNGKLLDRSINELYPSEVDDSERMEDQSTSIVEEPKEEPIALRTRITANDICKWTSGIPFNIPQKWNCENASEQNFTSMKVTVYTRTHVKIPAIKCSNITRTENETVTTTNCGFIDPYLMNGDIVIDKAIIGSSTPSRTPTNSLKGKLMMIETNQEEIADPENPKFQ
ncbi:unnamed protein product [Onchocerca ochengi]|uniref:Uncharacterized protein n=1 Tax=Onchocerca ochengi TaxID=42157 RepID=A0A182EUF5_ONCOC|nr:unnamed protein product [Onchocerca ochengi]